jgi:hypothetical protein
LGATLQYSGLNKKTKKIDTNSSDKDNEHITGLDILDNHMVSKKKSFLVFFLL